MRLAPLGLAFDVSREVVVSGIVPEGGRDTAAVRVAGIVPFLVMKGMALHDRLKEKVAWDIYFCLRYYPGELDALAGEFQPQLGHGLVQEGLRKIAEKEDWRPTCPNCLRRDST